MLRQLELGRALPDIQRFVPRQRGVVRGLGGPFLEARPAELTHPRSDALRRPLASGAETLYNMGIQPRPASLPCRKLPRFRLYLLSQAIPFYGSPISYSSADSFVRAVLRRLHCIRDLRAATDPRTEGKPENIRRTFRKLTTTSLNFEH